MLTATIKGMLAHKLRLVLTATSIALGVAFLSGTLMMSASMQRAFDDLFVSLNAGTDVVVRGHVDGRQPAPGEPRPPLPATLVQDVLEVDGVLAAEGTVEGYALLTDSHGKPIQPGGAPTLGMTLPRDAALRGETEIRSGRAPTRPDEVAVDASSLAASGLALGDEMRILFQGPPRTFTVVGTVGYGDSDDLVGATAAYFELGTAQRLLNGDGTIDTVVAKAADGTSDEVLADRIGGVLPAGVEARTGDQVAAEQADLVKGGIRFIGSLLTLFAGIALFVGSFIIWNTFSMQVAQRTRELALLRAIGATRRQVMRTILAEAVLVGAASAAAGLALGVGMAHGLVALMNVFGLSMPSAPIVVEAGTVVAGMLVGVVVTVVAAVAPARRATRVLPVEALRDTVATVEGFSRRRLAVGGTLALGGAGLTVAAVAGAADTALAPLGAVSAVVGVITLAPLFARPLAAVVGWPLRGRGVPGELARQNSMRDPRRTASTAMALVIGLITVAAVSVFAASLKASFTEVLSTSTNADLFVLTPTSQGVGYSPEVIGTVHDVDGVRTVSPTGAGTGRLDGEEVPFTSIDPKSVEQVLDLGMVEGEVGDLTDDGVFLEEDFAAAQGWQVGDSVPAAFAGKSVGDLDVQGLYQGRGIVNTGFVISGAAHTAYVPDRLEGTAMVLVEDGQNVGIVQDRIADAIADQPDAAVMDQEQFEGSMASFVDQIMGLITVLLLLAVVIALLGIVNTLALSVFERTRELGLLRAVGMTRGQVRAMVRWESVVISVIGALVGAALGTGLGVALTRTMAEDGIDKTAVPVGQLGLYVVAAAVAGVIAALGPARQASNVDVLRAVVSD
jgi:putative ABC transport system permease protein